MEFKEAFVAITCPNAAHCTRPSRARNSGSATHALNGAQTGADASSTGYDFGLRHSF